MLLIWLGVKVVSWIVQRKKYTYLVFGEYGRCQLLGTKVPCLLSIMNEEKKMAETVVWGENVSSRLLLPFLQGAHRVW